ncbi:hypothetical protein I4N56_004165 [Pseudomonas mohnii]|uniref:hypothetical protein n=1 Tax=Pseudomonas mohnii TaxID=395600 RepID=UPI0018DB03BF|nr:hypothetical protein [Pseudomonas mohnii]MBH8610221.1 hypothetical protein [Pseudomonas mohnii]
MTWINAAYWSPSSERRPEPARSYRDCVSYARAPPLVGASLLAMVVNDYAYELDKRGALESFASRLAPTGIA